jgi:hypothetical protein
MDNLYSLKISFDRFEDKEYSRIPSDEIWNDLWTNTNQYNEYVKPKNNGFPIEGIYSRQGWLDNPVLPEPIVMLGWLDLLVSCEMPYNNLGWVIFSKKIVSILREQKVEFKIHPLRILERSQFKNLYPENIRKYELIDFSESLEYQDDIFFGVQLKAISVIKESWDIFDIQNIPWIDQEVFLPPFFVDFKRPSDVLVTEIGKNVLEEMQVKGIQFTKPFQ